MNFLVTAIIKQPLETIHKLSLAFGAWRGKRLKLLGIGLIIVGLALLTVGVSAGFGILQDRTDQAAEAVHEATPPSESTSRTTVIVETPLGDVSRTIDTPIAGNLPTRGLNGVSVAGVTASLKTSQLAEKPASSPTTQGAQVSSIDSRLVPVVAESLAVGATVAVSAGLLAYFWPSVKTWVFRVGFIPLYAKISRAEVFHNSVREGIFNTIKAQPGVSASDLARAAGVSWGTTIYHLEVLEQNKMVSSIRNGRHRRYFENGCVIGTSKDVVAILQNTVTANVERNVRSTPGATQKELASATGMSPQALHWHLTRLVRVGVVRKQRDGRVVRHFAA